MSKGIILVGSTRRMGVFRTWIRGLFTMVIVNPLFLRVLGPLPNGRSGLHGIYMGDKLPTAKSG